MVVLHAEREQAQRTCLAGQGSALSVSQRPVPFRWTFYIGKDGKILKVDKKVRAGQDGANAAKTLKELGVEAK